MEPLYLLAHEGHDHAEAIVPSTPWWTNEILLDAVIIGGFIAVLLFARYATKARPDTCIVIAMAYLLITGMLTFQLSPALSISALTLGMGLALTTTLLSLAHKK